MSPLDGTNGYKPSGTLLQGPDGNFYGIEPRFGGNTTNNDGSAFVVTPGYGTISNLVFFNGTNGANPRSGLILGRRWHFLWHHPIRSGLPIQAWIRLASRIYGTVLPTGHQRLCLTPSPRSTTPPAAPRRTASLASARGVFYGTANSGGANSNQYGFTSGALFEVITNGFITNLRFFADTNGANPSAPLLLGTGRQLLRAPPLYGGVAEDGTVFECPPTRSRPASFPSLKPTAPAPSFCWSARHGNFYGSTLFGGAYHFGTIFKLTPANVLTTVATFNGTNGYSPSSLVQTADGTFYGTTTQRRPV